MQKIKVLALVIVLCCVGTAHCFALENITNETDTHTILPGITTTPTISVSPDPAQSSHIQDTASPSLVRSKTMDETGNLTPEEEKLSTALLREIDSTSNVPAGSQQVSTTGLIIKTVPVLQYSVNVNGAPAKIQSGTLVNVYISRKPGYSTHIVAPLVAEVTGRDEENHLAVGWVDVANLPGLADLEGVRNIREVTRPVVYMGSRLTQGDAIHRTANVRSLLGYTGAG